MSSMNFSTSKQYVRPPARGIFPLDHESSCKVKMEVCIWPALHIPVVIYSYSGGKEYHSSTRGQQSNEFNCLFLTSFLHRQSYLDCLKSSKDVHHKCRELSRDYLQCRMDHKLMSDENLDDVCIPYRYCSLLGQAVSGPLIGASACSYKSFFFFFSLDIPKTKKLWGPWNTTRGTS
jgi:hypothetical protein